MVLTRVGSLVLLSLASSACAVVVGTEDYTRCEEGDCVDDGGDSSTGSGAGCVVLTIQVVGDVNVVLDGETEVEDGGTITPCVEPGAHSLSAVCDGGGGRDVPDTVAWGNDACGTGPTCAIDAVADASFVVSSADCD